jgi:hypothetical protein
MDDYTAAKQRQWAAKKLREDVIKARATARSSIKNATDVLAQRLEPMGVYVHRKDLRNLLKETFTKFIATGADGDGAYQLASDSIVAAFKSGVNPIRKETQRPIHRQFPIKLPTPQPILSAPQKSLHMNIHAPSFTPTMHLNPNAAEFIPHVAAPQEPFAYSVAPNMVEDVVPRDEQLTELERMGSKLPTWLKNGAGAAVKTRRRGGGRRRRLSRRWHR